MAPESALLSAETDNAKKKKSVPKNPRTTIEKLAAAKTKGSDHRVKPREPPAGKKLKPWSLPPPGEAFLSTKLESTDKKASYHTQPMTTKEKQRAAEAMKTGKGSVRSKIKGQGAKGGGGKAKAIKRPSIFSAVKSQDASTHRFVSKGGELSVLVRPTAKTKRIKQKLPALAKQNASPTSQKTEEGMGTDVFRIMDLPREVRNEIWKLSVVDPNFLICPALPTGREQPDLAMVSNIVRDEVLPVYYSFNTFGIELSPCEMPKGKANGLGVIAKWGARLEEKGWFGMIRKWSFDFTPSMVTSAMRREESDRSFVVSVIFAKDKEAGWKGLGEVHCDALCILPGSEECGKCIVRTSPHWLVELVNSIADAAKGGNIRSRIIAELAKAIKECPLELAELRCEKTSTDKLQDLGIECV